MPNISLPKMAKLIELVENRARVDGNAIDLGTLTNFGSELIAIPDGLGIVDKKRFASEKALGLAKSYGHEYVMIRGDTHLYNTSLQDVRAAKGSGVTLYILNFYNQK